MAMTLTDNQYFEQQAVHVMRELREAALGVFECLSQPIHRAADLEKSLSLSRTLAWQLHRLALGPNLLAAGAHVPGVAAMGQALRAARKVGVPNDRINRVAKAMDRFEHLVQEHAGDRATFTTMINSLAGEEADTIDIKTRRQAFRVNSQAWGLQVKTFLACGIIHPGARSDLDDMAILRGLREVRRLRTDVPLRVSSQLVMDAASNFTQPHSVTKTGDLGQIGPKLLVDFCTKPCPGLVTRIEDGCIHTFLEDSPLGTAGQQTVYLADLTRDIEWQGDGSRPNHHIRCATITKPIETLVLDTLIHRDMFGTLEPKAAVYGSLDRLAETNPYRYHEHETVPIEAQVRNLGYGAGAVTTPYVPGYREMVEQVCCDAGWDASEFEVFRCVIEYPLLNTHVQVYFPLPERGNW